MNPKQILVIKDSSKIKYNGIPLYCKNTITKPIVLDRILLRNLFGKIDVKVVYYVDTNGSNDLKYIIDHKLYESYFKTIQKK